eukprot:COSAG02_NODE_1324_length_13239_cov_12.346804_4_plen_51_part_00
MPYQYRYSSSHRRLTDNSEGGFVGSLENSLRTAVHPSDHLESPLVLAHYY